MFEIKVKEKNIPADVLAKARELVQQSDPNKWAKVTRPNANATYNRVGSGYRVVFFKKDQTVLLLSMGKYKKIIDRL